MSQCTAILVSLLSTQSTKGDLSCLLLVSSVWQPSPAPCCSMLFLPSCAMDDLMLTPGKRAGGSSETLNTLRHPKKTFEPDSSVSGSYMPTHLHYHPVWRPQLSGSVGHQDKGSWFEIISPQIPRSQKITSDLGGLDRSCDFWIWMISATVHQQVSTFPPSLLSVWPWPSWPL